MWNEFEYLSQMLRMPMIYDKSILSLKEYKFWCRYIIN